MTDASATADRIHSAAIHVLRLVRRTDEMDGVSPARLSMLSVLVYRGTSTVRELAEAEGISSPSATSLLNGLEAGGLIRRSANARDRRAVDVVITPAGRRAFEQARRRRLTTLAGWLEDWPPSDLELLDQAAELLDRLGRA